MLVEQDPHQTRVAILEDDKLAELFIERQGARGVVGNVYKGRVSRVLPGMQAAFVDIGLERDAFLYVADVREEITDLDDVELGDEPRPQRGQWRQWAQRQRWRQRQWRCRSRAPRRRRA
jgi:ribonuclease G